MDAQDQAIAVNLPPPSPPLFATTLSFSSPPLLLAAGALVGCVATAYWFSHHHHHYSSPYVERPRIANGILDTIGHTPLIRLKALSKATGCEIFGKAEFLNPGGSVKDRVALQIIREALASGALQPGGVVTEGSVGSTGVSLALVCAALGLSCHVSMPDDAAMEKSQLLIALGAEVERVRPVSIAHPDHFVNRARRRAHEAEGALFADQFENLANLRAHDATGREIWAQCRGRIDAFIAGAGTGGTLGGVSRVLSLESRGKVKCYLVDPPGSSLYNRVTRNVMYTPHEAEGKRLKHPFDTIVEGIGLNRLTANFAHAPPLQGAFRATDKEAIEMARYLIKREGLFVGSSAAMNCVGAVKLARHLGPGHTIVTILCDGGHRHLSKFHNPSYLAQLNLSPTCSDAELDSLAFIQANGDEMEKRGGYGGAKVLSTS